MKKTSLVFTQLLMAILLMIAIGDQPYGYYELLRWMVSFGSLFVGYSYSKLGDKQSSTIFFFIAVLFNPLIPVYLSKDLWVMIDLAVVGYIIHRLFLRVDH